MRISSPSEGDCSVLARRSLETHAKKKASDLSYAPDILFGSDPDPRFISEQGVDSLELWARHNAQAQPREVVLSC